MSIKPNKASTRDYRKGYASGGTVWPDESSPYAESLPISGGSANLPGGTMQMGGPGVYDPEHPERGAQGWSTFYQPAEVPTSSTGTLGSMGETTLPIDPKRRAWGHNPI